MKYKIPTLVLTIFLLAFLFFSNPRQPVTVNGYTGGELEAWSSLLDQHISAVSESVTCSPYSKRDTLLGFNGKNEIFFLSDQIICKIVFTFDEPSDFKAAANRISEEYGEADNAKFFPGGGGYLQWKYGHTDYLLSTDSKKLALSASKY